MKISQLIAVMCLLVVSDHSDAQATEKEIGLDEITVTAQRRAESLQEAAIPVTAVSGQTLVDQSILQAADLTRMADRM
jgi:iron complex outermembrane recepter protein